MASSNQVLGWILIALGALLLLGWLHIPFFTEILGIVLIIVGILILAKTLHGPTWLAILVIVLGALILLRDVPWLDAIGRALGDVFTTIVAVLCIVIGVLKVAGKM